MVEARFFSPALARPAIIACVTLGLVAVGSTPSARASDPTNVDTISVLDGTGSTTEPGTCRPSGDLTVSTSSLCGPTGVAVGPDGSVYVVNSGYDEIMKYPPGGAGAPTVIAGENVRGAPVPGPATHSPLSEPVGVAVDSSGNVFIADLHNNVIEKVTPGGILSVVAGNGSTAAPTPGGPATASALPTPQAIAVDSHDNLYIAIDTYPQVLKIAPGGTLTRVAGTGTGAAPVAGPALASPIANVTSIAVDASDNLYLADWQDSLHSNYIEKIAGGVLSIVAGTPAYGAPTVGPAVNSALHLPSGVAVDAYGNVFVVESNGFRVDKIDQDGNLTVLTGNGTQGATTPGPAENSELYMPFAVAVDAQRQALYVTNTSKDGQLLKVSLVANPSAPRSLSAVPGNQTLGVTFTVPADPGYTKVDHYEFSLDGGAPNILATTGDSTVRTATLTGLTNGHAYSISVWAVNSSGGAGPAATIAATPQVPPVPAPPVPNPPVSNPPAPISQPSAPPVAPALLAPWFKDPLSAAQRRVEVAVPRNPTAYHGAIRYTIANYRSHNASVAVPASWIRGRHLSPRQAASLTGDNLFKPNTASLTRAGWVQVRAVVAGLTGDKTVTCEGYTDYAGSPAAMQRLSAQRAQVVCAALRASGAKIRTTAVGYGLYRPVIIGGSPANRAANRRVVVLVTS